MSGDEDVPVQKIPAGVRAIPLPEPKDKPVRFHPDTCGRGDKAGRLPRLDELDGDAFV